MSGLCVCAGCLGCVCVNIDKKFVHVSSCLGLVDLVWSNSVYTMKDNGQMERFIRLMRTIS